METLPGQSQRGHAQFPFIKVTQQLVKDVQDNLHTRFQNPIYNIKLKDVLGHKWVEVVAGMFLGAMIALLFHFGL